MPTRREKVIRRSRSRIATEKELAKPEYFIVLVKTIYRRRLQIIFGFDLNFSHIAVPPKDTIGAACSETGSSHAWQRAERLAV